ncbi:2'-5' RNA ligase family protein [Bartonella sp. B17]
MLRLFSALQIPQQTTQSLISLQNGLSQARWMNPQNFHITLYFFGEVKCSVVDEIIYAFNTIKLSPFKLQTLNLLHEQIQCIRKHLKLPPDKRKFTPHITIAQFLDAKPEDISSYVSSRRDFVLPPFEIDHFVLFSSPSLDDNVPYIERGSWTLQA